MPFIDFSIPRRRHFNIRVFLLSAAASVLGIAAGRILFSREAGVVSVFLTSFALLSAVRQLFDNNRREIWEKIATPYRANKNLGISLLVVFLGITLGYGAVTLCMSPETAAHLLNRQLGNYRNISPGFSPAHIDFGTFPQLLKHNFLVLLAVLFFALFYRTGGILLIITWNASVWGAVFSYIAANIMESSGVTHGLLALLFTYSGVFLHLITESAGYILCAMTGLFISKACVKYFNEPEKLIRVTKASFLIFLLAVSMLAVSALIESSLTPRIVDLLFR